MSEIDSGSVISTAIIKTAVVFLLGIVILSATVGSLADAHNIGSVSFTENPDDGDTITVDGTVFEFDSGNGVTSGNTAVGLGENAVGTYNNFSTAIAAAGYEVV